MVPASWLYIGLPVGCLLAVFVTYIVYRAFSRRAVGGLARESVPIPVPHQNTLVELDVMRGFSERLSIIEGRIPALQQMLDGYSGLSVRLCELEARLPSLTEAYDRYGTLVMNAEKRRRSVDQKEKNKPLTVEEVAAQAGLAVNDGGAKDSSQPATAVRAGVLGSGGNSQRGR